MRLFSITVLANESRSEDLLCTERTRLTSLRGNYSLP
jgi:hypothetical protein